MKTAYSGQKMSHSQKLKAMEEAKSPKKEVTKETKKKGKKK